MSLRVRFAPSPTGYLHVGGARTALFNWFLARRLGGAFILRIEDTDRARSSDEMTGVILHALEWLGLDWDEGPYFQSDGVERHTAAGRALLEAGLAYRDFSTSEELAREREADGKKGTIMRSARRRAESMAEGGADERAAAGEPFAVRFLVPAGVTEWEDAVHGLTRFRHDDIDDLVILRSDGTSTYNLAVVSDDAEMGITLVLRGDDHLSNTPKQILLYQALGLPVPDFGHVPMILGPDGKRLSKRHGAAAIAEYDAQGVLPEAMVNFLSLLGWSPGNDQEVMDPDEIVAQFSLDRILKKSSVFDVEKLEWLNGRHLSKTDVSRLEPLVSERLAAMDKVDLKGLRARPEWYHGLINLLRGRARNVEQLAQSALLYLVDEVEYEPAAIDKHWKATEQVSELLTALRLQLEPCEWEEGALEEAVRGLAGAREVGAGRIIHPLRVALTGQAVSPGIFEVLYFLGRERALARLDKAVETLSAAAQANGVT